MSNGQYHRIYELFAAAVELPADQRVAWLQDKCGNDRELVDEVCALLAEDERSHDPLESGVEKPFHRTGEAPYGNETESALDVAAQRDTLKTEVTSAEFCSQLSRIEVLSGDQLCEWLESVQPPERRDDPKALAHQLVAEGKLTEFQASALLTGKSEQLVIDKYLICDLLDAGGMGMVFKAVHRTMKRVVALKMLQPSRFSSPAAIQRFRREVEVAATLQHPNIVTAFDADETKGVLFLVMEYVPGCDLYKEIRDHGPMSVDDAVHCILQAAAGLQHAHDKGIIHRDVKPGNLILDKNKSVKILDLGLASISDAAKMAAIDDLQPTGSELTCSGSLLGTVAYMAPEQAMDSSGVDGRCDVYALGCTFYYLLTGETPYGGDSHVETIARHQNAEIPRLRAKRPDVPEAVDAIFRKMLAKDPADRQQSMAELVSALEACALPRNRSDSVAESSEHAPSNDAETPRADARSRTRSLSAQATVGGLGCGLTLTIACAVVIAGVLALGPLNHHATPTSNLTSSPPDSQSESAPDERVSKKVVKTRKPNAEVTPNKPSQSETVAKTEGAMPPKAPGPDGESTPGEPKNETRHDAKHYVEASPTNNASKRQKIVRRTGDRYRNGRMTPAEAQLLLDEHGPERAEREENEAVAALRVELFGAVTKTSTSRVDLLDLAHPEFEPRAMFELMDRRAENAPDATVVRGKVDGLLRRGLASLSSNASRYRVFADTSARDAYMEAWENERDAYLKEIVAGMRQELEERFEGHSEKEKVLEAFNRVWDNEPEPRAIAWKRRYSADLRKFVGRWGKLIRSLAPQHVAAVKQREAEEQARWSEIERKLAQADQILGVQGRKKLIGD